MAEDNQEKKIEKIDKRIYEGQNGLSDIFVKDNGYKIKLISDKRGYAFTYNRLWEEKDLSFFVHTISTYLMLILSKAIHTSIETTIKITDKLLLEVEKAQTIKLEKILKQCQQYNYCEQIFKMSSARLRDDDFIIQLNADKNKIPIKDGKLIDLTTLEVRDRIITDYFDFECDINYLPNHDLKNASRFFKELMNNNEDVYQYLQQILGYCITGETDQKSIFLFWGSGDNGKSVLCELMKIVLKKLCVAIDKKVFIRTDDKGSHTEFLIPLVSARLAIYSESEKQEKLNEALIKKLTGNDEISARALYGKQFSFKPNSKYIMMTNHKPEFDINDEALISRLKYIPFLAKFKDFPKDGEFKKDSDFVENLKTNHLDEVFSWLCIGANKYYQTRKIIIPKIIEQETQKYINDIDYVQKFFDECTSPEKDNKIKRSSFYDNYLKFCNSNGHSVLPKNLFFDEIIKKDYKINKIEGIFYVKDIKINNFE